MVLGSYNKLTNEYKELLSDSVHNNTQHCTQTNIEKDKTELSFIQQKKSKNLYAGVSEWSKETGLGPVGVGLRGFEPRPPHQEMNMPRFVA